MRATFRQLCTVAVATCVTATAVMATMPAVSAAPLIPPGIDFGSSGLTGPGHAPGGRKTQEVNIANVSLELPRGTRFETQLLRSNCILDVTSTSFGWNGGDTPFESCFYESSWAEFKYRIILPSGKVAVSVVRFDQEGIQPLTQGVRASCVGGNTGCIGGADYKESNDYRQLSPRFTLGSVPRGPERFCASEGETCYVPAATAVYYGVGDTYFVKQNVTGAVSCSSGTFGGDPAPGRFKDCFADVPSDPYE